jgi:putative membrane protein
MTMRPETTRDGTTSDGATSDGVARTRAGAAGRWSLALGAVAVLGVVLSLVVSWRGLLAVADGIGQAAPLLPALVGLHLGQLWLSSVCWRVLFGGGVPGVGVFYRLRIIREGIDSLLPVAQVGGEVVGTRLLARTGVPTARAAASVIVDVTLELLTQVADGQAWRNWLAALVGGGLATAAVIALQRLGGLRLLEGLLRGMARRWPALSGVSLDGLHAEALGFYRHRGALTAGIGLHYLAWALGSIETWAVLGAIGVPVSPAAAAIVESLGMAGRSAGFAIPAALGAQEGGFILAGAAVGVTAPAALTLSLVKRMREILVGSIGLLLWRLAAGRPPAGAAAGSTAELPP